MSQVPAHRMQITRCPSKCRFPSLTFPLFPTFWNFQSRNSECTKGQWKQPKETTPRNTLPIWEQSPAHKHKISRFLIHLKIYLIYFPILLSIPVSARLKRAQPIRSGISFSIRWVVPECWIGSLRKVHPIYLWMNCLGAGEYLYSMYQRRMIAAEILPLPIFSNPYSTG